MNIFILNILSHSLEDGENSVNQFAGFSKQDCLNQAFAVYAEDDMEYYDENFLDEDGNPVTEDKLWKALIEYGYGWNKSFENLDWTQLEVTDSKVKILTN